MIRDDLSTSWTFCPTLRRWQTPCTYTAVIRPLNVYLACYCTNLLRLPTFYPPDLEKWFMEKKNLKKNANIVIREDLSTSWKFCPTVQWWQTLCTYIGCYCTNLLQIPPLHATHLEEWFKEKSVNKNASYWLDKTANGILYPVRPSGSLINVTNHSTTLALIDLHEKIHIHFISSYIFFGIFL